MKLKIVKIKNPRKIYDPIDKDPFKHQCYTNYIGYDKYHKLSILMNNVRDSIKSAPVSQSLTMSYSLFAAPAPYTKLDS